jgi:hypothetical protein
VEDGITSSSYAFSLGSGFVIDAEDEKDSGWARFVNHSVRRESCQCVPVGLPSATEPFAIYFETTRKIAAGEELLIDYGKQYWDTQLGASSWYTPRRLFRRTAISTSYSSRLRRSAYLRKCGRGVHCAGPWRAAPEPRHTPVASRKLFRSAHPRSARGVCANPLQHSQVSSAVEIRAIWVDTDCSPELRDCGTTNTSVPDFPFTPGSSFSGV